MNDPLTDGALRAQTRYGSPCSPSAAAAAVLRARARANGVALRPASSIELAAAAIGADAWSALTGATGLEHAAGWGRAATEVLAAVLARAAGHPGPLVEIPVEQCAGSLELLRLAEEQVEWARSMVGDDLPAVLMRSGSDLAAAGAGNRFAAYGCLLQVIASEPG